MAHRKQCPSCGEELAHAAYSRHIHDHTGSVCPGRELQVQMIMSPRPSTSESSEGGSDFEDDLSSEDDSFDFGSAGDESDQAGCSYSADMPGEQVFNSDSDSSIYSDLSSNSAHGVQSDEEIWESSDDEDLDSDDCSTCDNQTVRNVLFGVSLFLNFFQLTYRVSERAMTTLLTFLRTLITYLATASQGNLILNALAQALPKSLYSIRKLVARYQGGVSEYAVCPVCHTLYALSDCIITENGMKKSKHCDFVAFPNHPHRSRRSKCNTALMKQVRVGGKTKLVPKKSFLYHSVISGLQKLIARKGFLQHCERWRDRSSSIPDGVHADIYDGNVWKEFQYINGRPFLASPANLCLMLNTDWFNPFDETQYSVGAIYLVVQNLPRSERFKAENIILIGLIPGPTEPSKTMNTYLVPLVDDLLKLYSGVTLPNPHSIFGSTNIRAVLSCIVCDLPATVVAHWPGVLGIDNLGEAPVRIGMISSFICHSVTVKTNMSEPTLVHHVLARVNWFHDHPRRDYFHPSVILCANTFECVGPASFIPASRIIARCAIAQDCWCKFDYGDDKVCIAVPLLKKVCI